MSQENVKLAWRASHAWNEGGVEAVLSYLDLEVEWHPPRESMEPGNYRGHAGVRDYLGRLGEIFTQVRMEAIDVIDVDAERVISVIRLIARSEKFGTEIDAERAAGVVRENRLGRTRGVRPRRPTRPAFIGNRERQRCPKGVLADRPSLERRRATLRTSTRSVGP